jgi:hypothetical protein
MVLPIELMLVNGDGGRALRTEPDPTRSPEPVTIDVGATTASVSSRHR